MNDRAWEDMLAEFRALGGTADNVRLGEGTLGRGLFPIDPSRPVLIRIPENLLLDAVDLRLEGEKLRVASHAEIGIREKAFLEAYEDGFSWGGGGRTEMERIFEQGHALPNDLRRILKSEYHCGDWFDEVSREFIAQKFIATRCIDRNGCKVMMPVVELANHGFGPTIAVKDGVGFMGTFPCEVFVRYAAFDAHGTFETWGFAHDEPQAFSIALGGKVGESTVHIGRELGLVAPVNTYWTPTLFREDGVAKLPFLMLGSRQHPRLCKSIFYKIMRDAGLTGFEEAFDTVCHANRMHFLNLLAAIELVEGPMVNTLRRMARFQLQALSYCYGQTN